MFWGTLLSHGLRVHPGWDYTSPILRGLWLHLRDAWSITDSTLLFLSQPDCSIQLKCRHWSQRRQKEFTFKTYLYVLVPDEAGMVAQGGHGRGASWVGSYFQSGWCTRAQMNAGQQGSQSSSVTLPQSHTLRAHVISLTFCHAAFTSQNQGNAPFRLVPQRTDCQAVTCVPLLWMFPWATKALALGIQSRQGRLPGHSALAPKGHPERFLGESLSRLHWD